MSVHPTGLDADLDHVLAHTERLWDRMRGARLFITGGTGFFGTWLLESFAWANRRLDLGAKAVVLSRNPAAFRQRLPHLGTDPAIGFIAGDVRTFDPPSGEFAYVIHAATESSTIANPDDHLGMFDTIVTGTRRVLELARRCRPEAFLFTSSGAVYGRQPADMRHVPETYAGAPDPLDPLATYGEGKRVSELLGGIYSRDAGVPVKIARCFAFVGPYLPLDGHFAIGNFLGDGLAGRPIAIHGDGTPVRSYLYAADLASWLWTVLVLGRAGRAYNVGSEAARTIAELATAVAGLSRPPLPIARARHPVEDSPRQRYVPDTERARRELGLETWVSLEQAIRRTLIWHCSQITA